MNNNDDDERYHYFIEIHGRNVHYIKKGEGPPLFFIHGLGTSVIAWYKNIDYLSSKYTVIAVDLPSHGDSGEFDMDYSLEAGLWFTTGFIDALELENVTVVGNSMGGLLAIALANSLVRKVKSLVLVDSAGLGQELSLYLRAASLPILGEIIESTSKKRASLLLKKIFFNPSIIEASLLQELARVRAIPGRKKAYLKIIRWGVNIFGQRLRMRHLTQLSNLKLPILIVWGAQDRIIPAIHAYKTHKVTPYTELKVFQNCGHWPQVEKALDFNRILLEFLDRTYRKPPRIPSTNVSVEGHD